MHLTLRTRVAQPPVQVMAGFTRDLFLQLAPPFPQMRLHRFDGSRRGDQVEIELVVGPISQRWTSLITEDGVLPNGTHFFVDEGQKLPGPLRFWRHRHLMQPTPEGGTEIIDAVEYRTASPVLDALIYPVMWAQFAWRKPIYRRLFR